MTALFGACTSRPEGVEKLFRIRRCRRTHKDRANKIRARAQPIPIAMLMRSLGHLPYRHNVNVRYRRIRIAVLWTKSRSPHAFWWNFEIEGAIRLHACKQLRSRAYGLQPTVTVAPNGSDSIPFATTKTSLSPGSMSPGTMALVVITLAAVAMPIDVTMA